MMIPAKVLALQKKQARTAAFAARQVAYDSSLRPAKEATATAHLSAFLQLYQGKILGGYMPMRSEISPLPAMTAYCGPVCVPVVLGMGQPLIFRQWNQDSIMTKGAFGAMIPAEGAVLVPDILIVPLVGFDRRGNRLGYGGGFYDRTLEQLRRRKLTLAVGYAFASQEISAVPTESVDQFLDAIITPEEVISVTI